MWEIRNLTDTDAELFRARVSQGFGRDRDVDEASRERFSALFDHDRTFAAFDGDDIIGTIAAFSLGLTVPGGAEVPMGGTTVITVKSTHRRRGVLREMMTRHLEEIAERGEPLAGLWASESSIYSRFGYGPATFRHRMESATPSLRFLVEPDEGTTLRMVDADKVGSVVRGVYESMRKDTHGALTRSGAWWEHRVLADPESWRGGKSSQRFVVSERAGTLTGYAIYRQKDKWEDFQASGEIDVVEVIVTESAAHREIWRFLANIDLFPNLEYWNMPVDDALPHLVSDQRRVRRTLADALWVRLMDVPAALEARRYESDGVITFTVNDPVRGVQAATYRLEVEGGVGHCESSHGDAGPTLTADALGHLYLGGGSAFTMAGAGRVTGHPGSLAALDRLFRTARAPWCPEVF